MSLSGHCQIVDLKIFFVNFEAIFRFVIVNPSITLHVLLSHRAASGEVAQIVCFLVVTKSGWFFIRSVSTRSISILGLLTTCAYLFLERTAEESSYRKPKEFLFMLFCIGQCSDS